MNTLNKILSIIGFLCFITACVLSITYMGFFNQPDMEIKVVLIPDAGTLWLVNAGFGIIGGILLNYRKFLVTMFSGLMASMAITGVTLLYVSWRESILNIELLIPLAAGVVIWGLFFNGLNKLFYPVEDAARLSKFETNKR
ncbi:MAG TPA: hypothetical protein VN514_04985 [Ignavibacteria bacterium]|nr:hypothetical protein [Ignavibacteria bacterium]